MMLEENLAKKRKRAVLPELDKNVKPSELVTQEHCELHDNCRVFYINAAFRSTRYWEVFVFIHFDYVVIRYDPASPTNNSIVKGPIVLCDGFPSLYGTCFQESGVTAAFGMGDDEAIIFSGSSCAQIYIEPETRTDAALESPVADEAYLFRGSEYALIDFFKRTLIRTGLITDEFPCLVNTMFASGIGTAFASHTLNQVYLFKDNFYVLIHFTPGEPNDSYIISGPEEIVPTDWPCLQGFIPFKTTGDETMEPKTWIPLKRRYGYVRFPFLPNDNLSKPAKPLHPEQCKPPLDYSYVQAAFHSTCKNEVFLLIRSML